VRNQFYSEGLWNHNVGDLKVTSNDRPLNLNLLSLKRNIIFYFNLYQGTIMEMFVSSRYLPVYKTEKW